MDTPQRGKNTDLEMVAFFSYLGGVALLKDGVALLKERLCLQKYFFITGATIW